MWRLKHLMPNSKDQGGLEGKTVEVGAMKVQVRSVIAEGGFSCVYVARDPAQAGKQFALKHIICNDGESLDLVKKEVAVMRSLRGHPNVVNLHAQTVYDLGRTKECFLLLEFCEKALVNVLDNRGAAFFDEKQILLIFRDVCNAVYAMHCQSPPIAHRDLKAENVLMGSDGVWKLCDFGSTSTNHKRFERPEEMGIEEDIIRKHTTPAYRAPEMWDLYRRELISEKVDIWALGCLLYRIAYLKSAFDGESKLQILNGNYRIPEMPRYSSSLTELIKDMLTAGPEERPDIMQIWRRVNELMPFELRKSNPDRPPSMAASEVHVPTDARDHGIPAPTRRVPVPSRSPPLPPSKEQDHRSSPGVQPDSKATQGGNSGNPLGAFWSTQYAQESVSADEKGPVFDKDPGFESAFKQRSPSPDSHAKKGSKSPSNEHPSGTAHFSKKSGVSNLMKKVHGSSQMTPGKGFDEMNSETHRMRFNSDDSDEGGEYSTLSKVSPIKTLATESDGPFHDNSFNAFVAEFDYSKSTSGNSLGGQENLQAEIDRLKEELEQVRTEKAEITSKYEKLTAICRSQRQEIQELKQAFTTSKEQRQRPVPGSFQSPGQPQDKTEGSIWELQEGMSANNLPMKVSDAKGWQAFAEPHSAQLSKSLPSTARLSSGGHVIAENTATGSNGYRRQHQGSGASVPGADTWGFVEDSFTSINNNPHTSKSSGHAAFQDEIRVHPPVHNSNSSKSEGQSARSLTQSQPAGWAGF
uniref:non-specific serine/threonine protein kinase n=1 Tax=Araucaria cunninghamii TaxID=56994 RepID=A0A0D6RA20_ARACU